MRPGAMEKALSSTPDWYAYGAKPWQTDLVRGRTLGYCVPKNGTAKVGKIFFHLAP